MASIRQGLLRLLYPLIRVLGKSGRNGTVLQAPVEQTGAASAHDLEIVLNNGRQVPLRDFAGRKLLLVNTASDCGYTGQYAALQKLQNRYQEILTVIAFPSNDFKEQEKADDAEIAQFCRINYGVGFPIAMKASVIPGDSQDPVFVWLTQAAKNGWNGHAPDWNFSKYLIDEQGRLTHYFGPSVSPLGKEIIEAVTT